MPGRRGIRFERVLIAIALVFMLAMGISACGNKKADTATPPATNGATAKSGLSAAQAMLTTMAPDAKLLVVQTPQSVTPTATPVWAYLFGSQKSGKTYIVYVQNGKAMPASEYGDAGLTKEQWGKVPGLDAWKIDSPEALDKALAISGAKGTPTGYMMGFLTYSPSATSTALPFVWNVFFDPTTSGVTTATIEVNATTGEAKVGK